MKPEAPLSTTPASFSTASISGVWARVLRISTVYMERIISMLLLRVIWERICSMPSRATERIVPSTGRITAS